MQALNEKLQSLGLDTTNLGPRDLHRRWALLRQQPSAGLPADAPAPLKTSERTDVAAGTLLLLSFKWNPCFFRCLLRTCISERGLFLSMIVVSPKQVAAMEKAASKAKKGKKTAAKAKPKKAADAKKK
jgi:hypothetical protein